MNLSLPHGLTSEQVRKYLDNRTQEFGGLGETIMRKDAAGLRMLAHRIKGNAALYGMPELGHCAARVVEAVDIADWKIVSEKVDAMILRLAEERARFATG